MVIRRLRPRLPRPGRRALYLGVVLAGALLGLAWALPLPDVSHRCPAGGEGLVLCTIQKAYLAAIVKLAAALLAAHLLWGLLTRRLPGAWSRWRAGARPRRRPAGPRETFERDAALRSAVWGRTPGKAKDARDPQALLSERVRAPRIVPVRSATRRRDDPPS
jgi:hypothetical protein